MKHPLILKILLATLFIGPISANDIKQKINGILSENNAKGASCGIYVQDLKTKKPLFQKKADKFFTPASVQKLLTSAVGLEVLKPDFKIRTSAYSIYKPSLTGIVESDLLLYGRGDPALDTQSLKLLAKKLHQSGIRKIHGNLVVSDSYFNPGAPSWGWEIGDTNWYYAPEITALSINGNALKVIVEPTGTNKPASVKLLQEVPYYTPINKTITTRSKYEEMTVNRDYAKKEITIYGSIPFKSKPIIERIALQKPQLYAGELFKKILRKNKISLTGKVVFKKREPKGMEELAFVESPPLSSMIQAINKRSDNLYTELLLNTIGKHVNLAELSTLKRGIFEVKNYIKHFGIDPDKVSMHDGCGLTKFNLITPRSLVKLLQGMKSSRYSKIFQNSLSIAGVDGSLAQRFNNTAAVNNLWAKTGLQSQIQSLAGYAKTKSGCEVAFSIILNNSLLSATQNRKTVDEITLTLLEEL